MTFLRNHSKQQTFNPEANHENSDQTRPRHVAGGGRLCWLYRKDDGTSVGQTSPKRGRLCCFCHSRAVPPTRLQVGAANIVLESANVQKPGGGDQGWAQTMQGLQAMTNGKR